MIDQSYRLNAIDRVAARDRIQKHAIQQVFDIWKLGERAAVLIRPTGFGKTYTVASLLNMSNKTGKIFKKVLFIYPMDVVADSLRTDIGKINRENAKNGVELIDVKNVRYQTYIYFANHYDDPQTVFDKQFGDLDLIVFDEFHCAGAPQTLQSCKKLFSAAKHARILGMTATYLRSDGVDPAVEIFGSHNLTDVYTYTDAVREGIMPKMIYYNAKYYRLKNADGSYIKAIDTYDEAALKVLINDALSKDIAEDNLLHNFGDNIRDSIINSFGEAALARSQRWLCLFPTISTLQLKKQEVYASFAHAFPDKTVKLLEVHGQDSTARSNLKLLYQSYDTNGNKIYNEWLTPKPDECVVILACRMLNMGYHAGVFTGEVLYGATSSNIVYQQQLGRTLDIMRNTEPIIIDLADAFGTIRLDASIHAAMPKRDKKNKTDKSDIKTIERDKGCYTNAVTDECLLLGTTQKAEIDLEIKLEEFRCKDYIRIIVDGVINGTIKDQKTLLFFARRYHVLPKYIYNTLKKAALAGKIDIIKTTIGTFGGVKRIENVTQTVSISPEHVKIIDELFKGIATI